MCVCVCVCGETKDGRCKRRRIATTTTITTGAVAVDLERKKSIAKAALGGPIGRMSRVFANDPRDCGSIPVRLVPKAQKMLLDTSLLNTQHYKVQLRARWCNPGQGVAPSPIFGCSSYWKINPRVELDNGRLTYNLYLYNLPEEDTMNDWPLSMKKWTHSTGICSKKEQDPTQFGTNVVERVRQGCGSEDFSWHCGWRSDYDNAISGFELQTNTHGKAMNFQIPHSCGSKNTTTLFL